MMPDRLDLSKPANQAKLDAVEGSLSWRKKPASPSCTSPLAFVMQHPALTAPIIGPRAVEQLDSQLGAADVDLDADVLDRIDQVVASGQTIADDGSIYVTDALEDSFLRRRRTA